MHNRNAWLRKIIAVAIAGLILSFGSSRWVAHVALFPNRLAVPAGQKLSVPWVTALPFTISASSRTLQALSTSGTDLNTPLSSSAINVSARDIGHYVLHMRLFGWLPWRRIPVDVTRPLSVVPGGESAGVVVKTRGLVVTQISPISIDGHYFDPAESAGIDRGDVILRVDHTKLTSDRMFRKMVEKAGQQHKNLRLWVLGSRVGHWRSVKPMYVPKTNDWQIGVAVRGAASGVGTMTFYNPTTHRYAALGHSLTDGVTKQPVAIRSGFVTGANIVGIVPGTPNGPGQKIGVLAGKGTLSGNVEFNGRLGIVGQLAHNPPQPAHTMPIALPDQVHPGLAHIITVLHGQQPQRFRVQVLKTYPQWASNTKGILFKVTDRRLLKKTGGVVQGMSGSPIIQHGKIVGAVTHVLISQPSLGYGCYAYWMARQPAFTR